MSESEWHRVTASREGRIGFATSTGLVLRPETEGCALPCTGALRRMVEIRYGAVSVTVPVLDVGPWFEHDSQYVLHGGRPAAEFGAVPPEETNPGTQRPARNVAGIDLFDGTIRKLGVDPERWGLKTVEWRFV